jgi:hypothetical protein
MLRKIRSISSLPIIWIPFMSWWLCVLLNSMFAFLKKLRVLSFRQVWSSVEPIPTIQLFFMM